MHDFATRMRPQNVPAPGNLSAATVNVSLLADPSGRRFFVEAIYPCVDAGQFPVKRTAGEPVDVWADILRDGHVVIAAALLWRREGEASWRPGPMRYVDNDRWVGSFTPAWVRSPLTKLVQMSSVLEAFSSAGTEM